MNNNKTESSTNSIFIKHLDVPRPEHKLNYKDILESIPEDKYENEQEELKKDHLCWRWRFLKISDKQIVEISITTPETIDDNGHVIPSAIKYIDKYGKWVNHDIDKSFDKYVVKQYFYYTSN